MGVKTLIKKIIELSGYTVNKLPSAASADSVYDQDGLRTVNNHDFMLDPAFCKAYQRGVSAAERDHRWHWRVHVGLWAAYSASKLKGDFVECGVGKGFLSSAIMEYLDWNSLDKTFYLMDTFSGLDERYVSEEELNLEHNKRRQQSGVHVTDLDSVSRNFSQWKNVKIIAGAVPDTLEAVEAENIAYLHLDMNCVLPEVAALKYFWDRLVPGGFVLFDDYARKECELQKAALDEVAAAKGLKIISIPTGQGLLIKPA